MTFSLASDLDFWKTVPAYKPLLKTILKSQIQQLVNQLSEHGGEESVFLTACMSDGTLSHIGSKYGQAFLDSQQEFKSQFLQFCCETDQKTNIQLSANRTTKKDCIRQKKVKKVKLADNVRCPEPKRAKAEDTFSENVTVNAATLNAVSESLNTHKDVSSEAKQGIVVDTITNTENEEVYTALCSTDTYIDDSTRDSDDMKESETETDEFKHIFEDDIVVKVEPNWDSGNEDHNTEDVTTMDDTNIKEDTTDMDEGKTIMEESTNMRLTDVMQDDSLSGPSTSSGKTDVHMVQWSAFNSSKMTKSEVSMFMVDDVRMNVSCSGSHKTYGCEECGKKFTTKHRCKFHIKNYHTDLDTLKQKTVCLLCNRRFSCQASLKRHKTIVHINDAKHACVSCPKRYFNKYDLMSHVRQQHSHEKLVCEKCGAKFGYRSCLVRHLGTCCVNSGKHNNFSTEFACHLCTKTFKSSAVLYSHKQAKHSNIVHICELCGMVFERRSSHARHVKNVHKH